MLIFAFLGLVHCTRTQSCAQIDDLRKELTRSETRIEQLTAELETSRHESGDWQMELERLRIEFKESSEKTFKVQVEVRPDTA